VKYKARFMVKGYEQWQGVEYYGVLAPVARMETVRLLLALVDGAYRNADFTLLGNPKRKV
jgi:hypothetical protein